MKRTFGLLVCATVSALQASTTLAASGYNTARIRIMLLYEGHSGLLVQQDGITDLGGCGRSDYFILPNQHILYKEIYAMLLSAYYTDLTVTISIDGCNQGFSQIRHAAIAK